MGVVKAVAGYTLAIGADQEGSDGGFKAAAARCGANQQRQPRDGLMALARRGAVTAASAAGPARFAHRTSCDPYRLRRTIGPLVGAAERVGAGGAYRVCRRAPAVWRPVNAGENVCCWTAINADGAGA
jgi:hypothetical protein